jgi:hypothetical protein
LPRALARTGSAALNYEPMKDNPMPSTTWTTDLTTTTNPAIIGEIRLWLKRNGQTIPSRDADAVAKYLRLAIDANNRWGGVLVPLTINRPRVVGLPWQNGFEGNAPRTVRSSHQLHSVGQQLAAVAFGLLLMLAFYVAFAG